MKFGEKRLYNDEFEGMDNVVLWDVLKIDKNQKIKVKFISKNSEESQGIRLAIDAGEGYIEVDGDRAKGISLWEDYAPEEVICECVSEEGLLSVYNIWEREEDGMEDSQCDSSGMIVEEKNGVLIYRCNDYGFEADFDKLVFSIEKI